jgi:hypothetical protein
MAKYEIDSIIICDDIRVEVSGKQILIGVYADVLLFPQLPTQISKLVFRIQVSPIEANLSNLKFIIRSPSNDVVANVDGVLPKYNVAEPVLITMGVVGLAVGPGTYTVELGLDQEPETIHHFLVSLPRNEEEKQRVDT